MEGQAQRSFEITAAAQSATLDATNAGEVAYTVTNRSAAPLAGKLAVKAHPPADAGWIAIDGPATRQFAPGAAEQVVVRIAAPPGAAAGSYALQLNAWSEARPDEDFTEGQSVAFQIAPSEKPKKPFPWWIVAIVVLVLVGIGVTVAIATGGDDGGNEGDLAVPPVIEPADGHEFEREPVTFRWGGASGARSFRLEIQQCPAPCEDNNARPFAARDTTVDETSATVRLEDFPFGRWRVVALGDGGERAESEFRSLRRLQPPPQPQLVAPPDGLDFELSDVVRFEWQPSEGADAYRLEVEREDNGARLQTVETGAGETVAHVRFDRGFEFARWRVVAKRRSEAAASGYRRIRCHVDIPVIGRLPCNF